MRKLKVVLASVLIMLLLFGSVFCVIYFTKRDNKAKVVTTIFPIYDICREILGSSEDIKLIQNNGSDMHSYEMSINDMVAISNAELFVCIGRENGIDKILERYEDTNSVKLLDHVIGLEESSEHLVEGSDHDHEHDHVHQEGVVYDEHIWLSVKNAIKMSEVLTEELVEIFPERKDVIYANSNSYIDKLMSIESKYSELCMNAEEKLVVADRFPFLYLTHDYNMDYFAVFSGCSDETQANFETITKVVDYINQNNVQYIFVCESSNGEIANQILTHEECREGVQILILNSMQSISRKNLADSSILNIYEKNYNELVKVFGL